MPKQQEPKPLTKSEMVLDVAMEAKYFRAPGTPLALVQVPNHLTMDKPSPLLDNYDFASWLMWRCYKKHGVIVNGAVVNNVVKLLNGMAMSEESIPVWTADTPAVKISKAPEAIIVMPPIVQQQPASQPDHPRAQTKAAA